MQDAAQSAIGLNCSASSRRSAATAATASVVAVVVAGLLYCWHAMVQPEDTSILETARVRNSEVQAVSVQAPAHDVRHPGEGSTNGVIAPLDADLAHLVSQLREGQRRLEHRLAELERQLDPVAIERYTTTPNSARPPTLEDLRLDQEAAVMTIDDWMASETPDPRWQQEVEGQLHASMRDAAGVTLMSIECGATLCRALAEYADSISREAFEERVLRSVVAAGGAQIIPDASGDGPPGALLYFVRKGHRFPETEGG